MPLTDPTDPLYSVDKIKECANRCSALAASGATVHSGSRCSSWKNGVVTYLSDPIAYSSKAFTIYRGDSGRSENVQCQCASAEDDCSSTLAGNPDYTSTDPSTGAEVWEYNVYSIN